MQISAMSLPSLTFDRTSSTLAIDQVDGRQLGVGQARGGLAEQVEELVQVGHRHQLTRQLAQELEPFGVALQHDLLAGCLAEHREQASVIPGAAGDQAQAPRHCRRPGCWTGRSPRGGQRRSGTRTPSNTAFAGLPPEVAEEDAPRPGPHGPGSVPRSGRRGGPRPGRRRWHSGARGSFSRHFRQIVSRSRGSLGRSRPGGTGSWCMTWSSVP